VVGFTRREVATVLVSELAILTLVALPPGLLIGSGFARAVIQTVNTEFVRLPLTLRAANFSLAVLVVVLASTCSAIFASRRLNQLDIVSVLKAHD
jgi:putative ABC transport system permease protein